MEERYIKRYISQKVEGYNSDFTIMYLACEVEYNDGGYGFVLESRPTMCAVDEWDSAFEEALS
jgi:hypothetical protein